MTLTATSNAGRAPAEAPVCEVRALPVIEEYLQLEKVNVDQGGYRVTKRVESSSQLIDELLRSDRVEIERRHINTALADDAVPDTRYEGDTLVIPVIEEVLITVKRLVLVEEVRVTRVKSTHRELQEVALRKEHIEIERLEADAPGPEAASPPTPQGQA